MKIAMYVITHKKFDCPKLDGYIPFQAGSKSKEDLGYENDASKENISAKNQNYCELTAVYWLWKNVKDIDVIGINHYRRYFSKSEIIRNNKLFLTTDKIEKFLKKYDIILPKREIYKETGYQQYCIDSGFPKDLDKIREIISIKHSNYLASYDEVMKGNKMHQFNMMICSKELYDNYCEWLFDILFELEKTVDLSQYNDYQKRIYGFLSERLLNVWIKTNSLKVKEHIVINTGATLKEKIKLKLRRIKNELIFIKNKKRNEAEYNEKI